MKSTIRGQKSAALGKFINELLHILTAMESSSYLEGSFLLVNGQNCYGLCHVTSDACYITEAIVIKSKILLEASWDQTVGCNSS